MLRPQCTLLKACTCTLSRRALLLTLAQESQGQWDSLPDQARGDYEKKAQKRAETKKHLLALSAAPTADGKAAKARRLPPPPWYSAADHPSPTASARREAWDSSPTRWPRRQSPPRPRASPPPPAAPPAPRHRRQSSPAARPPPRATPAPRRRPARRPPDSAVRPGRRPCRAPARQRRELTRRRRRRTWRMTSCRSTRPARRSLRPSSLGKGQRCASPSPSPHPYRILMLALARGPC